MTVRGRFVAFEGVDGCGKSTQVRRVASSLGALAAFEPGDTELGAALRAVVLDPSVSMTPLAEVLVMAADRAQHVAQVIEPALASGRDVVCDRYSGSTLAYQGFGRGLDLDDVRRVVEVASGGLEPDVTILLDCPHEVAAARRDGRARGGDRFESSDAAFTARVRAGFLELAASSPSWRIVDAGRSTDDVDRDVDAALNDVLS
ncbi:MAG TPA: dTMP kinase [Acidimicrobiales bacterium]|nr:dTMP kinase [Acidimicrobiales bacterium]